MTSPLFPGSMLTPEDKRQVMAWLDEMPVCFFVGLDTNGVVACFPMFRPSQATPTLSSFFRKIADILEGQ